eukprot:gene21709-16762_t
MVAVADVATATDGCRNVRLHFRPSMAGRQTVALSRRAACAWLPWGIDVDGGTLRLMRRARRSAAARGCVGRVLAA